MLIYLNILNFPGTPPPPPPMPMGDSPNEPEAKAPFEAQIVQQQKSMAVPQTFEG